MSTPRPRPEIHIGGVIRNAVTFDFKNWRSALVNTEGLLQAVARLFALLHERRVDYVLVGGVAIYETDVATLIHDYRPALEPLLKVLEGHLSDTDLAAVREVLADIQQRVERFGKGLAAEP